MCCWHRVALCLGLILALSACKSKRKKATGAPAQGAVVSKAAVSQGSVATSDSSYTVPAALSSSAVKSQYPKGNIKKARKFNKEGYRARKKDNTPAAVEGYEKAVAASPSYVPSRFNLACELARDGNADASIAQLEHLFRIGNKEARKYLSKTRLDTDFDSIRNDPRMKVIANEFVVDFSQGILKQLCADYGKVGSLVDNKLGLYDVVSASHDEYDLTGKIKRLKGGKARGRIYKMLDNSAWCAGGKMVRQASYSEKRNTDSVLDKWSDKYKKRCLERLGSDEEAGCRGGFVDKLCFVRSDSGWSIGATGHVSDAGADTTHYWKIFNKRAVNKAIKLFGG
jgi:hypothetical protein